MEIVFTKNFKKKFKKLLPKIQDQFHARVELFIKHKYHPMLHNHSVEETFKYCRSINITGDYRAIFEEKNDVVTFVIIGTHSELY